KKKKGGEKKVKFHVLMLKIEEKEKISETVTPQCCYNKDWVAASNKQDSLKRLQCLLCGQIANSAMELSCDKHKGSEDTLIVGEQCLIEYLYENNNQCPVGKHGTCSYTRANTIMRIICDLNVICPRQFMSHFDQEAIIQKKEEDITTKTGHVCNFKGKIESIKKHLENTCPLKPLECKFKKFGCNDVLFNFNAEQHVQSQMKKHLDLLLNYITIPQNKMKRYQLNETTLIKEIEQLKLEIKGQKDKTQPLKLDNKNIQIESNLRQKWNEKKKKMKKLQNNLQQEILKYRADFELLKKEFTKKEQQMTNQHNQLKTLLQEKNEKLAQLSKQNDAYKNELDQLKFKMAIKTEEQKEPDCSSFTLNFDTFRSSKLLTTFRDHSKPVRSIDYAIFDDGQFICSGSDDRTVRVWDIENNKLIQTFNKHADEVYCVKFSTFFHCNHLQNVICSSSHNRTIRFWDFKSGRQLQLFAGHNEWVGGIEFSPFSNGRYLCSGSGDKTIRLWDVETFKSIHTFHGHSSGIWCVGFSSPQNNDNQNKNGIGAIGGNGYTICSGSFDHTIRIWDIETTKGLNVFKGHTNYVTSVKYGTNELKNIILSGSDDKSIRLWDIRAGKQVCAFKGHTSWINAVEFSPFEISNDKVIGSSTVVCSGSNDKTIRFWDIRANKKKLYSFKGDDGISCLKFLQLKKKNESNNDWDRGIYLCYGSLLGSVCIWGHPFFDNKKDGVN
ncbi:hypothetical protein RFI_12897, partial [Reticulomyxa filosa]